MRRHVSGLSRSMLMYSVLENRAMRDVPAATAETGYTGPAMNITASAKLWPGPRMSTIFSSPAFEYSTRFTWPSMTT